MQLTGMWRRPVWYTVTDVFKALWPFKTSVTIYRQPKLCNVQEDSRLRRAASL